MIISRSQYNTYFQQISQQQKTASSHHVIHLHLLYSRDRVPYVCMRQYRTTHSHTCPHL